MYIEFVCNLLLQSEASGEQERLGELEAERKDRETWRRTGGEKREKRGEWENQTQKDEEEEEREDRKVWGRSEERQGMREGAKWVGEKR